MRSITLDDPTFADLLAALGKGCSNLRSLSIVDRSPYILPGCRTSWRHCRTLVKKCRASLQHLSLDGLRMPEKKPRRESTSWSPLTTLADTSNYPTLLTSLRLVNCSLSPRHIRAFWEICARLEVLELRTVDFELPRIMFKPPEPNKPTVNENGPSKDIIPDFSKLRELILIDSGPDNSLVQLECIIRRSPRLQKLEWQTRRYSWFPTRRFMYLFTAKSHYRPIFFPHTQARCLRLDPCDSPCWPELESISLFGQSGIQTHDYLVLVETAKRLRRIDLPLYTLDIHVVNTLTQRHSQTLREIDWRDLRDEQMPDWIQEVLSSCPMLTKVSCQALTAQHVIEGAQNWVCCDRLEELHLCIDMNPAKYNPPRADMSSEEERGQCRAVYRQLSRLQAIRVLDLRYQPSRLGIGFILSHRICVLPTTIAMGLDELVDLRSMEQFKFNGHQNMNKEDVQWILEHWTSLKLIEGGRLSTGRSRFANRRNPWDAGLARIFNTHGVQTPSSEYPNDYEVYDWNLGWNEDALPKELYSIEDETNIYEALSIDYLY